MHGALKEGAPYLFTCEHASNVIPETAAWDFKVGPEDRALLDDHWGYDLGANACSEGLADVCATKYGGGCAVLSRFSRLICDPNRPTSSPGFIVEEIDGHPIAFNQGLTEQERARRTRELYDPYHDKIDAVLEARPDSVRYVIGVHSYTPDYLGQKREMEIGVLFDEAEEEGRAVAERLRADGFVTALNEPWSGKSGLIYSPDRHAKKFGLTALEFEVRYDVLGDDDNAREIGARLFAALEGALT